MYLGLYRVLGCVRSARWKIGVKDGGSGFESIGMMGERADFREWEEKENWGTAALS